MFRDSATHRPLLVSNKSTQTVIRALVAANRAGAISDYEYAMTYAEICEQGRLPQAFGGRMVDADQMGQWKRLEAWDNSPTGPIKER